MKEKHWKETLEKASPAQRAGDAFCGKGPAEFYVRRLESNVIRFLPGPVRGRKRFAQSECRMVR